MGFSNAFIHPQQVSVKVFFDFKKWYSPQLKFKQSIQKTLVILKNIKTRRQKTRYQNNPYSILSITKKFNKNSMNHII